MKKSVLVLNAGYEHLHSVSPQRAVRNVIKGVAIIEEFDPERTFGPFPYPISIRLLRYVKMDWFYSSPLIWSKSGVLRRDGRICCYCGKAANTIDHVLPVSRGGTSSWENCVASCQPCNSKKDSKTPQEMGWNMLYQPAVPRREQLIGIRH